VIKILRCAEQIILAGARADRTSPTVYVRCCESPITGRSSPRARSTKSLPSA
jgi:hypothetical protein